MTATALQNTINNLFTEHLHIQPPSLDTDLIDSGTIDSLTFVELLAYLEQEFSIRIPLDNLDLSEFRSIARIADFIQTKLPKSEVSVGSHSRI